jgi:NAD(P)-dependent dehydrogenase (short-subunit alcohol dehydrogenase family)
MGEKPIMNGDENTQAPNEEPQSVEELRDDIEHTRTEMSATIDAIQEKLNPERIKENMAESVREATVGKARDIAHTVSEKAHEITDKAREAAAPMVQKVSDAVHHKNGNGTNGTDVKPNSGVLKPISEQVVVIMGASSGIGRESALQFAKRGAKVVVAARGQSALDSLVEDIQNLGGEAIAVVADTADFEQVKNVADQAAARFGRIDTWVHAAAISLYAKFEDTTPDEFRRILEVNLLGQIHGALAALPHLRREGRGTLIHISSVESEMSLPLQSAYACSKHGMVGFMDALRMELQNEGVPIYVADVKPAGINTPLFEHARTKLGVKPQPVPPVYQPSVVAEVILHAAENPTREITAGGAAQMMLLGRRISPALIDNLVGRIGVPGQKTNQPKPEDAPDNMFESQNGHGRVGGDFGKSAKGKSMGNFIELHPTARRAMKGAAIVAALYMLSRGRRS